MFSFNISFGSKDKAPATAGGADKGASGVGHEITRGDRTRRAFAFISGLLASADKHQDKHTLHKLREICRMHDRQSALISGLLNRALDNIFGSRFDFIPSTGDKDLDKKVKAFITPKMEKGYCDSTGVRDFSEMGKTSLRTIWTGGDCLLAKKPNGSMLAFEPDQTDTPRDAGSGKRIVLGVELNDDNRHVGYWVKQRKSRGDYGAVEKAAQSSRRISVSKILSMPAYRTRFNQTRGVPFLAAVLGFYDRFNNYLDFESMAAEMNAMLAWKITRDPGENDFGGTADNEDEATSDTFENLQKMKPGMIFDLLTGEDIDMIGSQRPGENFDPYVVMCARIIGVAIGFPLELVMLDFSKTNYSSARASLGEARRMFRVWQKFCETEICMPWFRWQIGRGIATGELPAKAEVYKARCQWPAWEYIDPKKEAEGSAIAIATRTKSRSQCIRDTGGDPDEVFQEIADENAKMEDLGIAVPQETLNVTTGPDGDDDKQDKDKDDE